jgi:hypothetical protein
MSIFSHIEGLSISNINNIDQHNYPACTINCYDNNNSITFDNYVTLCNTIKSQCPGLSDIDVGSTVDTYLQNMTNMMNTDQLNLEQNQSDEIIINTDLEIITLNNQLNNVTSDFNETDTFETNTFETDTFETNTFETDTFETDTFETDSDYLAGLADHSQLINIDCINVKPQRIINNTLGKYYMKKNINIPFDDQNPLSDCECPICIDKITDTDFVRLLPKCNHYFHKKCVDKWFKTNDTCPCCRHVYF